MVPDNLRLQPAELYPDVLEEVIRALAQHSALRVLYSNAGGVRGEAMIHPQALVQRGPIPYLFALKNEEDEPVRMYALHRMIRAEAIAMTPARAAVGFDLDRAIADGRVDFSRGELIDLDLRVRGYLAQLLSVCPLSKGQQIEDEPEGSAFLLRVRARVPSSGQLLRWLLGGGDNLEVIAPPELRECVAAQGAKIAALYRDDTEPTDEPV
jgi:predicted DNA-binding transcriptional regulator YafY